MVEKYKDSADIFGFGSWSPGVTPETIAYSLDKARLILEDKKPLWPTFHPWAYGRYSNGSKPVKSDELRCAVYMAIIHGAKGLGFFASRAIPSYKSRWPKDKPLPSYEEVVEGYEEMSEIIGEVHRIAHGIN